MKHLHVWPLTSDLGWTDVIFPVSQQLKGSAQMSVRFWGFSQITEVSPGSLVIKVWSQSWYEHRSADSNPNRTVLLQRLRAVEHIQSSAKLPGQNTLCLLKISSESLATETQDRLSAVGEEMKFFRWGT